MLSKCEKYLYEKTPSCCYSKILPRTWPDSQTLGSLKVLALSGLGENGLYSVIIYLTGEIRELNEPDDYPVDDLIASIVYTKDTL